jgi:hypothetical protein
MQVASVWRTRRLFLCASPASSSPLRLGMARHHSLLAGASSDARNCFSQLFLSTVVERRGQPIMLTKALVDDSVCDLRMTGPA